jgi:hypothetical protein
VADPRFRLGPVAATPGCLAAVREAGQTVLEFLVRHQNGDWGELNPADCALNDAACVDGSRILSAYHLKTGVAIWIISDAVDEVGQRVTTCLLPDEY